MTESILKMATFDIVAENQPEFSHVIDHSSCMERNIQYASMVVGMRKRLYASVSFGHEYSNIVIMRLSLNGKL